MRRRLLALALAAAFAAPGTPAFAMDLISAVRAAAEIDPVLASARAQLAATRERVPQAQAGLKPTVNATANANYNVVDTSIAPTRDFDSQSLGMLASVPIYRPANREALAQSELAARSAELALSQARQDMILRVATAYFDVLAAQDSLSVVRAQKQAFTEQYESARRNFEVGTATITDQQEAQSRLDLTRAQEAGIENDLEVRRALLAQLVGKPVTELFSLRREVPVLAPDASREGEWAQVARAQNYGVRQAELSGEIAKREIDRQRFGHYPTLDGVVQGTYGRSTNAALNAALSGVRTATGIVGLQFSMPIYTGGAVDARVREAIALQDRAQFDLENARRVAEQGARQTFLGVKSGLEQVRALEAAQKSSQLALESNQLGYQVGVRINIDVLNAAQQLFSTQRDLARARYDVLLNGLRLKNTAGDLTEVDVERINGLLEPYRPPEPPKPAPSPSGSARPSAPSSSPSGAAPAAPAARPAAPAGGSAPAVRGGRSSQPVAPR
ncbi:MAG: TolC family outer membrane protein [Burkholderiales bacterium]|jgi:outer membrane protein